MLVDWIHLLQRPGVGVVIHVSTFPQLDNRIYPLMSFGGVLVGVVAAFFELITVIERYQLVRTRFLSAALHVHNLLS